MNLRVFTTFCVAIFVTATSSLAHAERVIQEQTVAVDGVSAKMDTYGLIAQGSLAASIPGAGRVLLTCNYSLSDGFYIHMKTVVLGEENTMNGSLESSQACTKMVTDTWSQMKSGATKLVFRLYDDGDAQVSAEN